MATNSQGEMACMGEYSHPMGHLGYSLGVYPGPFIKMKKLLFHWHRGWGIPPRYRRGLTLIYDPNSEAHHLPIFPVPSWPFLGPSPWATSRNGPTDKESADGIFSTGK